MTKNVNVVVIEGRLTKDPEIRSLNSGTSVATFSIASHSDYKKDGEVVEAVNFIRCEVWGKPAQTAFDYMKRGMLITVVGSIKQKTWKDADDRTREMVVVNVTEFRLPPKQKGATGSGEADGNARGNDYPEDDLPFE